VLKDKITPMSNNKHRGHNVLIIEHVVYRVNLENRTLSEYDRDFLHNEIFCENCQRELRDEESGLCEAISTFIREDDAAADRQERFVNTGKNILLLILAVGTALYIF